MSFFRKDVGLTPEKILNALKVVEDPDLHRDIVSLNFIKNLKINGGRVSFDLELTTPACPVKDQLKQQCEEAVKKLEGVTEVRVELSAQVRQGAVMADKIKVTGTKNLIAVASGKGGVGKSTVAVNLAAALMKQGARVGILDADIYGPSIALMLGKNEKPETDQQSHLYPLVAHGIQFMSMALLSDENTPLIWRGPIVGGVLTQLLNQVMWDNLDYLILDLPPGTGDAQLTICQKAPLSGAVIVTTPQEVSLLDARKGLKMFEKVQVPILGIVENMSTFICKECKTPHAIFKKGGGRKLAEQCKVPFLGEIPIEPAVCEEGDAGTPFVLRFPESATAQAFMKVAQSMAAEMSKRQMTEGAPDLASLSLDWKA